jgi:hypothetical protein
MAHFCIRLTDFQGVLSTGYCLHTLIRYAELVSRTGYEQVVSEDISARFIDILQSDIERIAKLALTAGRRIKLEQSWWQNIAHTKVDHHRWGLVTAVKGKSLAEFK